MKTLKYKVTLTETMLGSKPSSKDVFTQFVASKKLDATPDDEIEASERAQKEIENIEKSMTVFHRMEGNPEQPIMWNYEWKGFFKDSCKALRRDPDSESADLKAFKSVIDGCIFVEPRYIPLVLPEGGKMGVLERPLRAETMQGPRVSLAKSETVPAGTTMEITVRLLNKDLEKFVDEWMEYGAFHGLSQWRNAGFGTFSFEKIEDESEPKSKNAK